MTRTVTLSLGELISTMYEEFLDLYGDEDLAALAVATGVQDLLAREAGEDTQHQDIAA